MNAVLIGLMVVINIALVIANIYRAYHPEPHIPLGRQMAGSLFGLVLGLGALFLLVTATK